MWIRDVDFPEELIEAHRAGKLVVFVGAGASRDSPADLPDFRTLTADIAADAQVEVTDRELEQPDVVLGQLADRQVDVHLRVATRLGVPSSEPNDLHRTLIDLALSGGPIRLVTTNYDMHLSSVLSEGDVGVDEYVGPALPVGDDFTGIVYLHGNLEQEPRLMVVTDRDFGRAYLRDAWAARFLERMFATFTVLFVGYSHRDVVMTYLARALGPDSPRFALTSQPEAPDWRQLDIHPVGYTVANDSHAALVEAINGWASLASMGMLDHRQRIAQLVSSPPSQVPEEVSYMESVVADGQRVRLFAELARGEEWLTWAAGQHEFQTLFDPGASPTDCTAVLAYWFAEHFVMDEGLTNAAMQVVREAGGRLGPSAWSAIGHELHRCGKPRPSWLGQWVVLLIQNDPRTATEWLDYALVASSWPEDRELALLLFDHLTEPQAEIQHSLGLGENARFDIRLLGDDHWLQEAWANFFSPNLDELAVATLAIVNRHLIRTHHLMVAAGSTRPGWDPVSFGRSAIEEHPQDRFRDGLDVPIDAARDCIESLLGSGDELGAAYLNAWTESDVAILQRLAIHGWTAREDVDSTAKVVWLRKHWGVFHHQLRHEIFRLIKTALPLAADQVAEDLVEDVVAGPDEVQDADHHAYERFNALVWITQHAPELASARNALEELEAEHPEFAERPHPDLVAWSRSGFVQHQPPMTSGEFHELIVNDVHAAIAELEQYEDVGLTFEGPTWQGALALIGDTARDHPMDGLAILDTNDDPEIVRAVIRGWRSATMPTEIVTRVLERMATLDLTQVGDQIASMLAYGGQRESDPTEWHRFRVARQLAWNLWEVLDGDESGTDTNDWLGQAINSPAGQLALFSIHAISADWKDAGETWAGIPAETKAQLESFLASDGDRTAMVEVVLASQLLFLFGADREWCEMHVLPLLDWSAPERARRAWHGFLIWGRWNDHLLGAGLLEHYLTTAEHADEFPEEHRTQLFAHLASIAIYSDVNPLSWLGAFTTSVDVDQRVEWINQVAWTLRRVSTETVEQLWARWMRKYWQDRLDSIPMQLTVEEASALAQWVPYLTQSMDAAVDLATAHPARLGEHADILLGLEDKADHSPAALARLVAHLMQGTTTPFWGCYHLAKLVPHLKNQAELVDVTAIIEEAVRLGCANAPNW